MNTGVTKQKVKRPNTEFGGNREQPKFGVRGKQDRKINLHMLYYADAQVDDLSVRQEDLIALLLQNGVIT